MSGAGVGGGCHPQPSRGSVLWAQWGAWWQRPLGGCTVTGSPRGPRGDGTVLAAQEGAEMERGWGGDIWGLLAPVSWPPRPGGHSISVPSGPQPGRGGAGHVGQQWGVEGSPIPLGPPTSARQGGGVPRLSLAQKGAHPGGRDPGTSQALASDVHKEGGGGQGRPVLGEQVDVPVPWGQRRGLSGWLGTSPTPGGRRGGAVTHLAARWPGAG